MFSNSLWQMGINIDIDGCGTIRVGYFMYISLIPGLILDTRKTLVSTPSPSCLQTPVSSDRPHTPNQITCTQTDQVPDFLPESGWAQEEHILVTRGKQDEKNRKTTSLQSKAARVHRLNRGADERLQSPSNHITSARSKTDPYTRKGSQMSNTVGSRNQVHIYISLKINCIYPLLHNIRLVQAIWQLQINFELY